MTQALNLANFANNLNTSGATTNAGLQNSAVTITAGTAMSGGGAVSLGGSVTLNNAGVTSLVAGTGIAISGATGAVTVSSTASAGVTSLNGQTGAVVTTTWGNIGSVAYAAVGNTSGILPNDTIAGSSLYYPNTLSYQGAGFIASEGTTSVPFTRWYANAQSATRTVSGNTGWTAPQGVSTLSGTWRAISIIPSRQSSYDSCGNSTSATSYAGYFVRIS